MPRRTSERTSVRTTIVNTPWGFLRWRTVEYEYRAETHPAVLVQFNGAAPHVVWIDQLAVLFLILLVAYVVARLNPSEVLDGPLRLDYLA